MIFLILYSVFSEKRLGSVHPLLADHTSHPDDAFAGLVGRILSNCFGREHSNKIQRIEEQIIIIAGAHNQPRACKRRERKVINECPIAEIWRDVERRQTAKTKQTERSGKQDEYILGLTSKEKAANKNKNKQQCRKKQEKPISTSSNLVLLLDKQKRRTFSFASIEVLVFSQKLSL